MSEAVLPSHLDDHLNDKLASKASSSKPWTRPDEFDLTSWADRRELERRLDDGTINTVDDKLEAIADDLFEMQNPHLANDNDARAEFIRDITSQSEHFGRWFQFDWRNALVRFPDQSTHQELRTFRNKNLITDEEQRGLLGAHAVVFGLSVGSNVVDQLVQGGIGGVIGMGDFDTLAPTNLNRIRASMKDVGDMKIDIAAKKISELDPYIEQVHFREGLTPTVLEQMETNKPDILFDEIDNLAMKAMLRVFAREHKVPLIMATDLGDKSIIDVERHDIEDVKPFLGRLSDSQIQQIITGEMSEKDRQKLMIKIVGIGNITPRILDSAIKIGDTLGGLPQLGSTAAEGGALAAVAARELLIGNKLDTGRYVVPMRKALKLQPQTSFREGASTVMRFIKASKENQ